MKRLSIAAAMLAVSLTACGKIEDTKLTPELLESQSRLEKVSNRLSPEDRKLFGNFVMQRKMAAGGLATHASSLKKDPETVGQAISVMRKIDAINAECEAKDDEITARRNAVEIGSEDYVNRYNKEITAGNALMKECAARRANVTA